MVLWENVFVKHLLQAAAVFTSRYHSVLSQPRDNGEAKTVFVASSVQIAPEIDRILTGDQTPTPLPMTIDKRRRIFKERGGSEGRRDIERGR